MSCASPSRRRKGLGVQASSLSKIIQSNTERSSVKFHCTQGARVITAETALDKAQPQLAVRDLNYRPAEEVSLRQPLGRYHVSPATARRRKWETAKQKS